MVARKAILSCPMPSLSDVKPPSHCSGAPGRLSAYFVPFEKKTCKVEAAEGLMSTQNWPAVGLLEISKLLCFLYWNWHCLSAFWLPRDYKRTDTLHSGNATSVSNASSNEELGSTVVTRSFPTITTEWLEDHGTPCIKRLSSGTIFQVVK